MIFVDVPNGSTKITVSGDTYNLRGKLGMNGLGLKFDSSKRCWNGDVSLKALETLSNFSGVILTPEALDMITQFQRSAAKRAAYLASRRNH